MTNSKNTSNNKLEKANPSQNFVKNLLFFHIATQFMNVFYSIGWLNFTEKNFLLARVLFAVGFLATLIAFYFEYRGIKLWPDLKLEMMSTMLGAFFVVLSFSFRILPVLWIFTEIFIFEIQLYISVLSNVFYGLWSLSFYYSEKISASMKKSFFMLGILHILLILVLPFLVIASIIDIIVLFRLFTESGETLFQ